MTRHVLRPALCLFAAVVGSGCVEPSASVGSIAIPLTAPGPDGSTYHLPSAVLRLDNPGYHAAFSLDVDGSSTTFDVPAGDYSVSAFHFAGDGDLWPLIREDADGTLTTVLATLDLAPAITVVENQTTGLVFRFHIPSVGPITFSLGSVAVSVDVEGSPASSLDFVISAPSMQVTLLGFGSGPGVLLSRLPGAGSTGDGYQVIAQVAGPWSLASPNQACAPVFATASATGQPGFVDLVREVPTSDRLCIEKGDHTTVIQVSFHRVGNATTPLLSDLGDGQPFVIDNRAVVILDDNGAVFDGRVLRLDALLGSRPELVIMASDVGVAAGTLPDGTTLSNEWFQFQENATGTLALFAQ